MSYAGESIQKKIARAMAYEAAAEEVGPTTRGGIVCLAGPGAHDVGPISCYFPGVPASDVMFVDYEASGLDEANKRLPGCRTHLGSLHEADIPWPVALAVLDFCGHLEGNNFAGALHVMRRMALGAVALITTLRARETKGARAAIFAKFGLEPDCPRNTFRRAGADLVEIGLALGLPQYIGRDRIAWGGRVSRMVDRCLTLVDCFAYNGPVSPMLVSMYRKETVRQALARESWDFSYGGEHSDDALVVARRGVTPADATLYSAKALDVSPGTLAAWKAHRTMGTYAKPDARTVPK